MKLSFSWLDVVFAILLIVGVFRGRKRGMSMELLPVLQVLIIVAVGSQVYEWLGKKLFDAISGSVDLWLCYWIAYLAFALFVHMLFTWIKRAVGEKLVGSDIFGSMEYYFGMTAGMVRYACLIIMFMALMNARQVDLRQVEATRKMQQENFGNISFPTPSTVQMELFDVSQTGKFARKHFEYLLIKQTAESQSGKTHETIGSRKQSALDEVMGGKSAPKK
jgi:uncharacterized membrane protein required for colicin V production